MQKKRERKREFERDDQRGENIKFRRICMGASYGNFTYGAFGKRKGILKRRDAKQDLHIFMVDSSL